MNKVLTFSLFGVVFVISINRLFANQKKHVNSFYPPNTTGKTRGCDPMGCGYFGASRNGHTHKGLDFTVREHQAVKAPFPCTIVRYGYPYADDYTQRLVEINGINAYSRYRAKIMYINGIYEIGTTIQSGKTLCYAGNIAKKHGNGMTNHVHFELYDNGKLIDPTPFFKL